MTSISPDTKVVLITGANQGIGYEIARQLTTQHENFHVLIGARSAARGEAAVADLQKLGCSVEPIEIDVTSDASISNAASIVKAKFGHLDVLINNAGTFEPDPAQPIAVENLREHYLKTFDVNLFGQAVTTETFAPLLDASPFPHPKVIFTSGTLASLTYRQAGGRFEDNMKVPAYRCSKVALNMLGLNYSKVGAGRGWIVNCFCPGFVPTSLTGFHGKGTVEEGVKCAVKLVVEDGETGTFVDNDGDIAW